MLFPDVACNQPIILSRRAGRIFMQVFYSLVIYIFVVKNYPTSWSRVLLNSPVAVYSTFSRIPRFITVATKARHSTLYWASWIHPTYSRLLLECTPRSPMWSSPSHFPIQFCMHLLQLPSFIQAIQILSPLIWWLWLHISYRWVPVFQPIRSMDLIQACFRKVMRLYIPFVYFVLSPLCKTQRIASQYYCISVSCCTCLNTNTCISPS
jgi:hypothetical protein